METEWADIVNPDQTASLGLKEQSDLVDNVCTCPFVRKRMFFMVFKFLNIAVIITCG